MIQAMEEVQHPSQQTDRSEARGKKSMEEGKTNTGMHRKTLGEEEQLQQWEKIENMHSREVSTPIFQTEWERPGGLKQSSIKKALSGLQEEEIEEGGTMKRCHPCVGVNVSTCFFPERCWQDLRYISKF